MCSCSDYASKSDCICDKTCDCQFGVCSGNGTKETCRLILTRDKKTNLTHLVPIPDEKVQYQNSKEIKVGVLKTIFGLWPSEMATVQLNNGAFVTLPLDRLSVLHEPAQCGAYINLWGERRRCKKPEHDYRTVYHETDYTNITVKWISNG